MRSLFVTFVSCTICTVFIASSPGSTLSGVELKYTGEGGAWGRGYCFYMVNNKTTLASGLLSLLNIIIEVFN